MVRVLFFAMLMGVLSLQSCVRYRIKVIEHGSMKYYEPQKRTFFSWEEMTPFYGHDLPSAKTKINEDRNRKRKKFSYIKY